MSYNDYIRSTQRNPKKKVEKLTSPFQTTAFLTLIGAASALVARLPPIAGTAFEAPNTLIQYQRWCPVCETVALNQACIAKRASCQASNLMYVLRLPTLPLPLPRETSSWGLVTRAASCYRSISMPAQL